MHLLWKEGDFLAGRMKISRFLFIPTLNASALVVASLIVGTQLVCVLAMAVPPAGYPAGVLPDLESSSCL